MFVLSHPYTSSSHDSAKTHMQLHPLHHNAHSNSFAMKVTLPLSASAAQAYVVARNTRRNDATWEVPATRYVESMLEEHGMKGANPVVTPALARNVDDEDEGEATTEEH